MEKITFKDISRHLRREPLAGGQVKYISIPLFLVDTISGSIAIISNATYRPKKYLYDANRTNQFCQIHCWGKGLGGGYFVVHDKEKNLTEITKENCILFLNEDDAYNYAKKCFYKFKKRLKNK